MLKIILMNSNSMNTAHTPLLQTTDYTCGPVSLLNILRMKGDSSYSEQELATMCGATETGTDNAALVNLAKRIGLQVVEEKRAGALTDIQRHIDSGSFVIVNYFLTSRGFGHFSVVIGYDDETLYLADSYVGHLRIEKKNFSQHWHDTDKTLMGWYVALK